jgi:hypothetical protein
MVDLAKADATVTATLASDRRPHMTKAVIKGTNWAAEIADTALAIRELDPSPTYSLGMRGLKIRGKLLAVAAMAVLVPVLGACTHGRAGPAGDGPLSSGLSIHGPIPGGGICAPGGRAWAFGFQSFTNYGKTTVVLDRVMLLHPRNEHLVGSYAVPGAVIVGAVRWPPKYPGTPAGVGVPSAWKHRQPVHGFRLAPGKSFNMVLGVAAITGDRWGTSQGMLVYYHDSSGAYVARNYWSNDIAANGHACPSS